MYNRFNYQNCINNYIFFNLYELNIRKKKKNYFGISVVVRTLYMYKHSI